MPASPTDTSCPRCGAGIPVPETGLNMVCQYCGHEAPVPDMEQRREAMERHAAHQRQLEAREQKERHRREREREQQAQREIQARKHQREQARKARRQRLGRRLATIPGCLLTLVIIAISLAAPGVGLYQAGLLDAFVGSSGASAHSAAQRALLSSGYTAAAQAQQVRLLGSSGSLPTVELRQDLCYAFAVGSGALITSVEVLGPTGSVAVEKNERAFGHALALCPEASGIHQLRVEVDQQFGRYTWSWAWKAKAGSPSTSTGSSSSSSVPRAPRPTSRRSSKKR